MAKAVKARTDQGREFISSRGLAERWGVSKKTILRRIRSGELVVAFV